MRWLRKEVLCEHLLFCLSGGVPAGRLLRDCDYWQGAPVRHCPDYIDDGFPVFCRHSCRSAFRRGAGVQPGRRCSGFARVAAPRRLRASYRFLPRVPFVGSHCWHLSRPVLRWYFELKSTDLTVGLALRLTAPALAACPGGLLAKPLAAAACFGSAKFPPLAALTFAASSIICAFGLASAAPRSPYRHLELCGIAISLFRINFPNINNHSAAGPVFSWSCGGVFIL